uniref:heme oxygenase (biliverdin-producing) n=1 Tax=Cryptomonas curvata TaxID=233186 RepID=A0A222AHE8_9CRYP|nr:heme oxygenase [Cryptomonas curvata]ASO75795.1 heme oxygenase [Cryptomonas curvata]
MVNNLATQLREGTSKSHSMAENVSFVKSFLGGVIDKESYRKLISNLYFVYSAMEEEMEKNKIMNLLNRSITELNRNLELDLEHYYGSNWKSLIRISEATKAYVERIKMISNERPELLIAHAYTRYLGDLSGGQILKKLPRAMNLSDGKGLSFYEFEEVTDEQEFKQNYKRALDSLPLDSHLADNIVAEANISFTMNMKMFQELETSFSRIIIKLITNWFSSIFQPKVSQA